MKYIKIMMLIAVMVINQANANQCTNPSNSQNILIKNVVNLTDTSPFFKKHQLSGHVPGNFDVDTQAYEVSSLGNRLRLTGNSWKSVDLKELYRVTPNTYLEFEFLSNGDEAEINGVGLIMQNNPGPTFFHGDHFFQVHGTQTSFNQDYHNYSGTKWQRYTIPLWSAVSNFRTHYIDKLLFAGDDDGSQVNQSVYYKNVRLVEGLPSYQFPAGFQHSDVIIQPTSGKNYFHHIYPQVITGPDGQAYPVSGAAITKRVYSPPNTNIEEIVNIDEQYYENMCWEQPINHTESVLASQAMASLQAIANNANNNAEGFRNVTPVILHHEISSYFDPKLKINGVKRPRFVTSSIISSNQDISFYFERIESGAAQTIASGFRRIDNVNCNDPATGENTRGVCFDLTGKTEAGPNNNYLSENSLNTVNEDLNTDVGIPDFLNHQVISDSDNKWRDNDIKKQTTELLVNTADFNDYLIYLTGTSYEDTVGYRPDSVIGVSDLRITNLATFWYFFQKAYFRETTPNTTLTPTRDRTIVAHEFAHGLSRFWFGAELSFGSVQGCALNEAFSDIMGYGTEKYITGIYNPAQGLEAFDNNDFPGGIRNSADPSLGLSGGQSLFTASPLQTAQCDASNNSLTGHSLGNVITHLYHLMVTGGFNIDSNHRPDVFGVSSDETFSNKAAEKVFYNAMAHGSGPENSQGEDITLCTLRNNMLSVANNVQQKTKIQQAWKQVYQNIEAGCPLPYGEELAIPDIEISYITDSSSSPISVLEGGTVNFGSVGFGASRTYTFKVKNLGDYNLRLYRSQFDNLSLSNGFSQNGILTNQQTMIEIGEEKARTVTVKFKPNSSQLGLKQASLVFTTNHPDFPRYRINLRGTTVGQPDAFEEDDIRAQAHILINISQLPPGPENQEQRNFNDDNIDWVKVFRTSAIGTIGPHQAFVSLSNPQNFQIEMCYEIIEVTTLINTCVNIPANSSHSIDLYNIQPIVNYTREYLIKLTKPPQQASYDYNLFFTSTVLSD